MKIHNGASLSLDDKDNLLFFIMQNYDVELKIPKLYTVKKLKTSG